EVLGHDIYAPDVELPRVHKQIGMVFQRPNPLPISIRDNVLFGYRILLPRGERVPRNRQDEIVEDALRNVLLWDTVKSRLRCRATGLSLEEQQKLCIARLLPVKPAVLLMDEPCSALDPEATRAIEELIWELRGKYTIMIVTHNMAQARRASDECVFMLMGKVIEHGETGEMFVTPQHKETADYVEGLFRQTDHAVYRSPAGAWQDGRSDGPQTPAPPRRLPAVVAIRPRLGHPKRDGAERPLDHGGAL
ncbi:MAG: phosphate ABC transporter ATP-binding protein, partial [Planctomycetota bacterium]